MNMNEPNTPQPPATKRAYEKPRIEESGDFERLVLACAFNAGGGDECDLDVRSA